MKKLLLILLSLSFAFSLNIDSLQKGLIFHAPLNGEHLAKDVTPYGNDGIISGSVLSTGIKGETE